MFKFPKALSSIVLSVFLCGAALTANAATYTVTKTADTNDGTCNADCSLREAVGVANNNPIADTINFAGTLNNQTIALTLGEIFINSEVTISNPGTSPITVSGSNISRIFFISDATVTIDGLTLINGNGTGTDPGLNGRGGAIYAEEFFGAASLTLRRSTVRNSSSAFIGGGIDIFRGSHKIIDSTINNNKAEDTNSNLALCGGLSVDTVTNIYIINSTISNNQVLGNDPFGGSGGGICNIAGVMDIRNSTIADNSAYLNGGGILNADGGTISMGNTIVASNTAPSGPDIFNDLSGSGGPGIFNSLGNNLIGNNSGTNVAWNPSDILNQAANLAPLAFNGGLTQTRALFSNSIAINAGNNSLAVNPSIGGVPVSADQRGTGFNRIVNAIVDIGAFEYRPQDESIGNIDIAITGPAGWASIPIARSLGDGSFSVTNQLVEGFSFWASFPGAEKLTGDFNNDGRTDIALLGPTGWASLPVAFSNGDGTFTVTNKPIDNFSIWASFSGATKLVGDFNNDGKTDIALVGPQGWTSLPVAFSNGDGTFTVTNKPIDNFSIWASFVGASKMTGDFNNDGRTDIALVGPQGWVSLPVAFSNGDGTFTVTNKPIDGFASYASFAGVSKMIGDFNNDGRTDIALVGPQGWVSLPVAFSNGDGTFTVTNKAINNFATWASFAGVTKLVADFNGDGRTDIALVGPQGWVSLPVAFSNGDGTFTVTNKPISNFATWASYDNTALLTGRFN